jgi:hypothetical protein
VDHEAVGNFNTSFCGTVVRLAAAACIAIVICTIMILTNFDPSHTKCSGWIYDPETTPAARTSFWSLVLWLQIPGALGISANAAFWRRSSQHIANNLSRAEQLWLRNGGLPLHLLDLNLLFLIVAVGWTLFCSVPLILIFIKCTA